jgi:hypothetical protein
MTSKQPPAREPSPEAVRAWKEMGACEAASIPIWLACPSCRGQGWEWKRRRGYDYTPPEKSITGEYYRPPVDLVRECLTCKDHFAAMDAAVAQEREACAMLCEETKEFETEEGCEVHGFECARAIRSRQP